MNHDEKLPRTPIRIEYRNRIEQGCQTLSAAKHSKQFLHPHAVQVLRRRQ
jgi:hypothetical protein